MGTLAPTQATTISLRLDAMGMADKLMSFMTWILPHVLGTDGASNLVNFPPSISAETATITTTESLDCTLHLSHVLVAVTNQDLGIDVYICQSSAHHFPPNYVRIVAALTPGDGDLRQTRKEHFLLHASLVAA
ncbi:unnamed protein product [Echinostoma caproni]|uniref:Uncharacterized protein n=1 Tax=Echinostoma caproni TaxID=27848 RepID=A0A183A7X8_9TREM|nr:unnamed protein product [Echinostoma caproni]